MDLEQARYNMIEQQVRPWYVLDQTVLDIMRRIPREKFVAASHVRLAYADIELPLDHGELMMHPRVEGRMLQELAISVDDSCLEIGTGSGYVTACLAHMAKDVYSIDVHQNFIETAQQRLLESHLDNVELEVKEAFSELDTSKQYDAIAVTGSVPEYTFYFEKMLKPGGRLFMVVGTEPAMHATLVTRTSDKEFTRVSLFETVLQPLQGITQTQSFSL